MQAAFISPPSSSFIPITRAKFLGYSSRTTPTINNHRHHHRQQLRFSVINRQIDMAAPASPPSVGIAPKWAQKTITIPAQRRGCHLVTSKILKEIGQDLSGFKCGLAHFFCNICEEPVAINLSPLDPYNVFWNCIRLFPVSPITDHPLVLLCKRSEKNGGATVRQTYIFTVGKPGSPDDMPAHIKSSMFGCSLTIPITDGKLNIGTWQGIWLCEHRDAATPRKIVVTLNGI
ncbi:hypothetical protein DH2020_035666 [Rehmannia glutinosa]|uniref:Uncharacterized protein n=1 Tax=Rehmannia glutinosa TaxID=99300 RepID=A0ABR0V905_REHGL